MKQNNRQTLPLGRSTKEVNAGLSLLQSSCLFIVHGNSYIYCTEIVNTISKNTSDFISRLTIKKFSFCKLSVFKRKLSVEFPVLLIRSSVQTTHWIYF